MTQERRREPRVPYIAEATVGDKWISSFAFVEDISTGGVRIRVPEYIPLSSKVCLKMNLSKKRTLEVWLKPAWIHELVPEGIFEIGARFVELTDEDRRTLVHLKHETLTLVYQ